MVKGRFLLVLCYMENFVKSLCFISHNDYEPRRDLGRQIKKNK